MSRRFHRWCYPILFGWVFALVPLPMIAQDTGDDEPPPAAEQPEEPAPEEPAPEEPAPEEPAPEEPAPEEPAPEEPAPEEPAPEEPAPEEPAPEEPAPEEPAPEEPAPEEPAPEEPAREPDPAADPETDRVEAESEIAEANQAFADAMQQWKDLLKDLRELRVRFQDADPTETAPIVEQWNEKIARGEQLIDELRLTGLDAYRADPRDDSEVAQFLVSMAVDDAQRDNYEPAAQVVRTLLDHGSEHPGLIQVAGMVLVAVNDFVRGQEMLAQARDAGLLSELGQRYLQDIPAYIEYWEVEKALRQQEAEADDLPRVLLSTSQGDLIVELLENEAPETVANFISLVSDGFYDGLSFHRVIPGFMAQGGCPVGDGTGGPGYRIYCECHKENHRKHFRGTLSMAHAGRNTGGSQFFLTFLPTPHLNGAHTVFGRVIEGMEVLAKLQRIDPSDDQAAARQPDRIMKAEVIRKRDHDYQPRKVE